MRDFIPESARKWVYSVYGIIGLVLGAFQVAFAELGDSPVWLGVALAVYTFVGGAVGLTALSNTGTKKDVEEELLGE